MVKRVTLITGVAGGIGRATAEVFASEGWRVVGVDRMSDPNVADLDLYIQADASDPDDVSVSIGQVTQQIGRLDALINNAAIQICKPIIEMDVSEWDRIMDVNVRSTFLFCKAAYPLLQTSKGCIVNVSSVHALATSTKIAAYAASKGALLALSRALAIEFAPDNIRVNAILPGAVDTPMLRAGLDRGHVVGTNVKDLIKGLADRTVIGRVATPHEIARAVLFLADKERSSFITGHALVVDGGATARLGTE